MESEGQKACYMKPCYIQARGPGLLHRWFKGGVYYMEARGVGRLPHGGTRAGSILGCCVVVVLDAGRERRAYRPNEHVHRHACRHAYRHAYSHTHTDMRTDMRAGKLESTRRGCSNTNPAKGYPCRWASRKIPPMMMDETNHKRTIIVILRWEAGACCD